MGLNELTLVLFGALLPGAANVQHECVKPEGNAVARQASCGATPARGAGVSPVSTAAERAAMPLKIQRVPERGREDRSPEASRRR